jgi:PPM family protein phosphatase
VHASVYTATRLGGDHERNQDRALVGTSVIEATDGVQLTEVQAPTVLAVFDGLGGHAAGDGASELAAQVVADAKLPADQAEVTELLRHADQALLAAMREEPARAGMGTTAALLVLPDGADPPLTANVGDSTIWHLRDDLVEELSVSDRWQGSGVLQCLGANDDGVTPHVRAIDLRSGDRVLIATDGLTDVVPSSVLHAALHGDPVQGGQALLAIVEHAGVPDDVTFVVVDIQG